MEEVGDELLLDSFESLDRGADLTFEIDLVLRFNYEVWIMIDTERKGLTVWLGK